MVAVALSPDGKVALTACDRSARLWDTQTGQSLGAPLEHKGKVVAVAFSRDGMEIATLGPSLEVWNVSAHSLVRRLVRTTNLFVGGVALPVVPVLALGRPAH